MVLLESPLAWRARLVPSRTPRTAIQPKNHVCCRTRRIQGMTLRTQYDAWHQRVYESDPQHEDASSPWYELVRQAIGPVAGLQILEVACGRGGFARELANAGANVAGCDFSFSALQVGKSKANAKG